MNVSPTSSLVSSFDSNDQLNQAKSVKLLQLTDTHLFVNEDGALLSLNTAASFKAVVDEILKKSVDFDCILATGDISQDHTLASYQHFEQGIKPLHKSCFWLPGNHDNQINMNQALPSTQIRNEAYLQCARDLNLGSPVDLPWQIILLSSQVEGTPYGELSPQQLAFLDQKLSENAQLYSLVLLHHHPIPIGSAWIDQHCLHNAEAFWQIMDKHSNVKGILCGHVHQDFELLHKGIRILASPSTCVQFKPNSDEFALDELSPGWREIELFADGSIKTRVQRLDNDQFLPDFDAQGY